VRSWEARAADPALHPGGPDQARAVDALMSGIANEVVDYMLFVDEPPLPAVASRSGFAGRMAAQRAARPQGSIAVRTRPDAPPAEVSVQLSDLLAGVRRAAALASAPSTGVSGKVLSGQATEPRYRALSLADRQAMAEILIDTKPDLPDVLRRRSHG
jgi:hypothetical protein